ncbi:MAG: hypothetical protein EOL87_13635 [Spartobacteria bacterium]|nr:hypothetical protein [Spartobacteria bacterium]
MQIWVIVMSLVLLVSTGAVSAQDVTTVLDFNVPEYDGNGNLKSELLGDSADIYPDGRVVIKNIKIDSYKAGQVALRITSPLCEYSEDSKSAWSDAPVRISADKMVVTGTGFSWDSGSERMKILSDVKVVLKNAKKQVNTGDE